MMKLDEAKILNLATKVSNQLAMANSFCDDCMYDGSCECSEKYCNYKCLQNTLMSVMEELCCSNPFLLDHLSELKMPVYFKDLCKNTIQKRAIYKALHSDD